MITTITYMLTCSYTPGSNIPVNYFFHSDVMMFNMSC